MSSVLPRYYHHQSAGQIDASISLPASVMSIIPKRAIRVGAHIAGVCQEVRSTKLEQQIVQQHRSAHELHRCLQCLIALTSTPPIKSTTSTGQRCSTADATTDTYRLRGMDELEMSDTNEGDSVDHDEAVTDATYDSMCDVISSRNLVSSICQILRLTDNGHAYRSNASQRCDTVNQLVQQCSSAVSATHLVQLC
jgi:hypothetical protein